MPYPTPQRPRHLRSAHTATTPNPPPDSRPAAPSKQAARARAAEASTSPSRRLPGWLPLIPALLTLGITLWQIQGPSFTMDEDASLLAVNRTFPQLISLLGKIDVVHGAYLLAAMGGHPPARRQ